MAETRASTEAECLCGSTADGAMNQTLPARYPVGCAKGLTSRGSANDRGRMRAGEVRIGTSGWSYDHWQGVLYPPRTSSAGRLDVYAAEFDTVELNASFYHWPRAATFAGWRERVPDGFLFTVKAPRGLTHARRLRDPHEWMP